jgi:hypothetical protein
MITMSEATSRAFARPSRTRVELCRGSRSRPSFSKGGIDDWSLDIDQSVPRY